MSYAVVHMQKVNAGGIRGIQSHVNREHPPKTNPDIDPERSRDNYAFVESRNFYRDAMRIVRENAPKTKTVRKDAVLLCNFVVTSDHEFSSGSRGTSSAPCSATLSTGSGIGTEKSHCQRRDTHG